MEGGAAPQVAPAWPGRAGAASESERRADMQRFEYTFVRLGEGWLGVRREAKDGYQKVIEDHARKGWRLVQVFAPGVGPYGAAKYYELIFERPV